MARKKCRGKVLYRVESNGVIELRVSPHASESDVVKAFRSVRMSHYDFVNATLASRAGRGIV